MKRRSFAVFFLILSLLLLAIPQLSAQNAPAAVIGIRDAGCESQSPQVLGALNAALGLEKIADQSNAEDQSNTAEIASITGLNVPGFMGFYNACAPTTTVYAYHGENAQEELSLYHVSIDDFAANLFANWSWDPVNTFAPKADQFRKRMHIYGSATEDTVPYTFGSGSGARDADGILKQTAINVTDSSAEKLRPGVYFLQFSTPDFEHSHGSYQSDYRTKYFLNVATATLTLKRGGGQMLVWAIDVNSGEAVAAQRIDIYGGGGALLASGVTDESGVLALDLPAPDGRVLAVLKTDQHFALGYTDWDTNIRPEGQPYIEDSPLFQIHVYTDRQVYLAGQRVYFHGTVRSKDDMSYTLPDFKTVTVGLRDASYRIVKEQELELNEFGSFHGVFDFGGYRDFGTYAIRVYRPADDKSGDPRYIGGADPSFTIAKYHKLSSRGNSSELEMETRASSSSHDSGPSVDDQGFEEIDTIRLIGEKTRFKVGERAKIQINSPFAGEAQALVTIERGNVVSQDLITLPNNSLTYEFEILPEHVPNIYISAFIVNATSADGHHPLAAYQMGITELRVEPERKSLNIDIGKVGQSLSPPGKATYELRVTDYKGDPVAAEVSVALVDPAAHSPLPQINSSLLVSFYGRQQLSVSTSSSLVASAEGEPGALRFSDCCGGGCGGQFYEADAPTLHDSVIETSYWNPTLRTNADGVTTFELSVPESLPSWSLDVRAFTASADGSFLVGEKTFDLPIDLMD